jgi:ferredoxin-NADP reductase
VDVCHLFFSFDDDIFTFVPGQYAILNVPSNPSPLKRLYSFAGTNTIKNKFDFLIKIVPGGVASEYIRTLEVGDEVDVTGPAGLFKLQNNEKRKIFMATGTGIAPIRSFLSAKSPQALNSILFWGLKNFEGSYMMDELLTLKNTHPDFMFYYCLSQQVSFETIPPLLQDHFKAGHIDAAWEGVVSSISPNDEYYLCGSRTVIESLRVLLLTKGVEKGNLYFEKY